MNQNTIFPDQEVTLAELAELVNNKQYAKALPHLKKRQQADPANIDLTLLYSRACRGAGKASEAEKALRPLLEAHPLNQYIQCELAVVYFDKGKADKADTLLESLMKNAPDDPVLLARALELLGRILWADNVRDEAVKVWLHAAEEDPSNEAVAELLRANLNMYGKAKAPNPIFDDFYHFRDIHIGRYFSDQDKQDFSSIDEANRIFGILQERWNELMSEHARKIDSMKADERTRLFSSMVIDFKGKQAPNVFQLPTQHLPDSPEYDEDLTDDEVLQHMHSLFPFLEMHELNVLPLTFALHVSTGFDQSKLLRSIREPVEFTEEEENMLHWGCDLAEILMKQPADSDPRTVLTTLFSVYEMAREELEPEDATDAVFLLMDEIERYGDEAEKEEAARARRKNKPKKKPKKRRK